MADATDHDQLFKETIREFFPAFLRLSVPQYADKYDFASLRWLDKELFPAPPDGPSHELDLVAELRATEPVAPAADGSDPTSWLALVHVRSSRGTPPRTSSGGCRSTSATSATSTAGRCCRSWST